MKVIKWPAFKEHRLKLMIVCVCIIGAVVWFLPVRRVIFYGDFRWVDRGMLQSELAPVLDVGIVRLSLKQVRLALLNVDGVAEARVWRHWPGDLKIQLQARQPLMRWGDQGVVDASGVLFYVRPSLAEFSTLPELIVPIQSIDQGVKIFHLLQAELQAYPKFRLMLVRYVPWKGWQVELSHHVFLVLGDQHISARFRRWLSVSSQILKDKKHRLMVDLRYRNGFSIQP